MSIEILAFPSKVSSIRIELLPCGIEHQNYSMDPLPTALKWMFGVLGMFLALSNLYSYLPSFSDVLLWSSIPNGPSFKAEPK